MYSRQKTSPTTTNMEHDIPLDERTIYLWHRVQAGPTEVYSGLEWSLATEASLQATNEHDYILHSIRKMCAWEVRRELRCLVREKRAGCQSSP